MEQSGNLVGNFAAHLDVSLIESEDWDQNCPVFIQKLIKKCADIRITVVGENVYGASLLQSDNNEQYIDFRQSNNLKTSPYDVPSDTSTKLKKVLKHLGLRFASCDFCLERGNLYFLEANVTGNYLWVEMEALLPITRSVINLLSE
jgi:glutathione synthase/RimK-type ligase-like ATP-grasp enzyme